MSFPAKPPAQALAEHIDAQTSLTVGTDLFYCLERPPGGGIPSACVFVNQYSGGVTPYMGAEKLDGRDYSVQVLTRGNPDDEAGALTQAQTILAACNRVTTGLATGYYELRSREPAPVPLGRGDDERYRFSNNFLLRFEG